MRPGWVREELDAAKAEVASWPQEKIEQTPGYRIRKQIAARQPSGATPTKPETEVKG